MLQHWGHDMLGSDALDLFLALRLVGCVGLTQREWWLWSIPLPWTEGWAQASWGTITSDLLKLQLCPATGKSSQSQTGRCCELLASAAISTWGAQ